MPKPMTELELFHREAADNSVEAALASLVGRLLVVIPDAVPELPELDVSEFRRSLKQYRAHLAAAGDPDTIQRTGGECVTACRDFFARAHGLLADRADEIAALIDVLREALASLAGEAASFNSRLISSSEKFRQLVDVNDVRELRVQLEQEVAVLQRIVVEKQKQDELHVSKLSRQIESLESTVTRTTKEALLDALTGIANRRACDGAMDRWIAAAATEAKPFVVAMADLDDFKQLNDRHGYVIGDRVLICAAHLLKKGLDSTDFLARYGGEEFIMLLDGSSIEDAERRLTALLGRVAVSQYRYDDDGQPTTVNFTFSCGLTPFAAGDSAEDLVKRAGAGMHDAKRRGKNQVVVRNKSFLQGLFGQRRPRQRPAQQS